MFKLASLFVEIVAQTDSLDRALGRTHANLSTANVALGTFAGNVAASFARMAIGAAGGLFEATIGSASHLAETVNRVKVVLGDSADKAIKDADVMADRYGTVKSEVLGAVSSFSLLGREMKLSESGSADLGVKLTRMASELTSFFDPKGDLAGMMHKLESGLAGQARPLRELGIFMTAEAVKAQAAKMGLQPGASGQLSEADKIKARIAFIENSKAMQLATGDLERTLDSTANQTRKFWGTLSNLATSVGEELNPAWNTLLQSFNEGLESLKGYFQDNKSVIRGWGDSVVESFETAKLMWRNLPEIVAISLLGADQKAADALTSMEAWATKMAVATEKPFIHGAQKAVDFFKYLQDLPSKATSFLVSGLEAGTSAAGSVAGMASNAFDAAVGPIASAADVALRPIRDAANAIEKAVGADTYKQMSVEEDIGRLKGSLMGAPEKIKEFGDYLKVVQFNLAQQVKAKPEDVSSALIAKADQHLAKTLGAGPASHHAKEIAALEEVIRQRETKALNAWVAATEEDIMASMGIGKHKGEQWVPATEKYFKDLMNVHKAKEEWMPASEAQVLAESRRSKKLGEGEDEDAAVAGGKHHKAIQDTASFAMNLRAANLSGGDVQDKQLSELQLIRQADQKNAEMMERMLTQQGMAVFG